MTNLFTPPPGDLSIKVLDLFFGPGWQTLLYSTSGSGPDTVISTLFHILNTTVLSGLCLLMMYVWIVGIGQTAYDGQALGKNYHTIHTPLRIATGVSLLMPLPWAKGFCLIQLVLLSFVGASIGVADTAYHAVNNYLADNTGQINTPPQLRQKLLPVVQGMFSAQVAGEVIRQRGLHGNTTYVMRRTGYSEGTYNYVVKTIDGAADNRHLGDISIPCADKTASACESRRQATISLYNDLQGAACAFAHLTYVAGDKNPCSSTSLKTTNDVKQAILKAENNYLSAMSGAVKKATAKANEELQDKLGASAKVQDSQGWLTAGAYAWMTLAAARQVRSTAGAYPTFSPGRPREISNGNKDVLKAQSRAVQLVGTMTTLDSAVKAGRLELSSNGAGHVSDKRSWLQKLAGWFSTPSTPLMFARHVTEAPLIATSTMGSAMVTAAETGLGAYLLWRASVSGVSRSDSKSLWGKISSFIPGIGGAKEAAIGAAQGLTQGIGPLVLAAAALLMSTGIFAEFVIPLTPTIVWSLAALGWIILVLELIVASVLWAAAHAVPGGEGFLSQYAQKGYLLAVEALLTPFLMLIGYYCCLLCIRAFGLVFGPVFEIAASSLTEGGFSGLITDFALIVVFMSTTYFAVRYSAQCITIFRDKILGWLGSVSAGLTAGTDAGGATATAAAGGGMRAAGAGLRGGVSDAGRSITARPSASPTADKTNA